MKGVMILDQQCMARKKNNITTFGFLKFKQKIDTRELLLPTYITYLIIKRSIHHGIFVI